MKHCPNHCKIFAYSEDKFCYTCGAELVAYKKCSCGRELSESAKFCPNCGKEVG